MAADGYIRSAITQLQSAVVDMQTQMQALEHELDGNKHQLANEIDHLDMQRKTHEAEMARITDSTQQQMMLSRIRSLQHDAEDRKGRIQQLESEVRAAIQRKNQVHQRLQDFSNQLEQVMASPEIR